MHHQVQKLHWVHQQVVRVTLIALSSTDVILKACCDSSFDLVLIIDYHATDMKEEVREYLYQVPGWVECLKQSMQARS